MCINLNPSICKIVCLKRYLTLSVNLNFILVPAVYRGQHADTVSSTASTLYSRAIQNWSLGWPARSQNISWLLNQERTVYNLNTRLFVYTDSHTTKHSLPHCLWLHAKSWVHFCLKRNTVTTHWGAKQLSCEREFTLARENTGLHTQPLKTHTTAIQTLPITSKRKIEIQPGFEHDAGQMLLDRVWL